ncbi:MAG TPA: molybdenum cofactor biosynthesis protein MoaE [Gemmatimonadales bacterium]|nr:molybdenum cofactor biosynthesis protein MoaE [Gemmatimonadales bacterium]
MPFLTEQDLQVNVLAAEVAAADRGAIVSFVGTVRDHHAGRSVLRLEYSAYAEMAESECEAVILEAERRWSVAVTLRHRIGQLAVGDAAVAVVVASAHREAAFDACRFVIDEVKRRVPIWKKEYYADGSVAWVDPTAPGGTVPSERLDA